MDWNYVVIYAECKPDRLIDETNKALQVVCDYELSSLFWYLTSLLWRDYIVTPYKICSIHISPSSRLAVNKVNCTQDPFLVGMETGTTLL